MGRRCMRASRTPARWHAPFDELASWLTRHNAVPDGSVLLTGTGIVPPTEFTLEAGDIIRIAIDCIGTLENRVRVV